MEKAGMLCYKQAHHHDSSPHGRCVGSLDNFTHLCKGGMIHKFLILRGNFSYYELRVVLKRNLGKRN
jgi:hypothetical protein